MASPAAVMRALAKEAKVDDFTARMFDAINGMMLAAIARKDYEDRRRRQMQGEGCWQVRRNKRQYARRVNAGRWRTYSAVQEATGCSRATVAKIDKRARAS